MLLVIAACIPGVACSTWYFGIGVLINIVLAASMAIALEACALKLRGKELRVHLADNSALVTAVLFAIALPPGSAWWLLAIGIFFAIVIVKHSFGGLGQNLFNPAMCGYLLLLLSFPLDMTYWHIPNGGVLGGDNFTVLSLAGFGQSITASLPIFNHSQIPLQETIDGLTMATPLIEFEMGASSALLAARDAGVSLFSRSSETAWELINIAYLIGGLFLLYKKIISWHIPVSIIATITVISTLFYAPASFAIYGTPYLHLFGSATMIGAFFIATDPVSAATTSRGKIFYGIIIGLVIYSIRVWGSYPDSIAIAVLFGNFCAPALDYFCRPRIYGHGSKPKHKVQSEPES
jgi:electron transport complex protein RnfD